GGVVCVQEERGDLKDRGEREREKREGESWWRAVRSRARNLTHVSRSISPLSPLSRPLPSPSPLSSLWHRLRRDRYRLGIHQRPALAEMFLHLEARHAILEPVRRRLI